MKQGFILKIIKIIVINIIIIFLLLGVTELFFAGVQTNSALLERSRVDHQSRVVNQPKLPIDRYLQEVFDRIHYFYFEFNYNSYFNISDFRKPAIGSQYKNKNIILAGCSYTYGDHLDYKDTMGVVMSEFLKEYKFYNIGLSGSSPRETLYILRNYEEYAQDDILPQKGNDTKYFIYTFIDDQERRLINNVYKPSPSFKVYKDKNGDKKLKLYKASNIPQRSFLYRYYTYNFEPGKCKYLEDLFELYMKEIKADVNRLYPNAKVVLLIYCGDSFLNIPNIEKLGIKVINLYDVQNIDFCNDEKYLTWDKGHPNRYAWETIVPILQKKLNF